MIVNVDPAIVSVPVRAVEEFAETAMPTTPLPIPLLPLVTEIHMALDVAVHEDPTGVATPATPPPPPRLNTAGEGAFTL